jgi:predicted ArsR family transcriptional regulator
MVDPREEPDAVDQAASALASLADPTRRRLYRFVAREPGPVSREQAAEGVGVAGHTAKFHLDKLVDEGLLEVEFRRLTGRTGPGAGRPAKLYRRSDREVALSLPERHYDLLGRILAEAVEVATDSGTAVGQAAASVAHREGHNLGEAAAGRTAGGEPLARLASTLEPNGYEPRLEDDRMVLENCPFDRVARDHTELVCGLNLHYVEGVLSGLGCAEVQARLEPSPGRCCVSARATGQAAGEVTPPPTR